MEFDLLASVYKGEGMKKSCLVFSPLRLRSFRAKLRCLRLACRSYEQPNRASDHMVVMALLESVCAATERPWHALCADPISGLASENSKSVEGSKSMLRNALFFSCIQTPKRTNSMQTTIRLNHGQHRLKEKESTQLNSTLFFLARQDNTGLRKPFDHWFGTRYSLKPGRQR